VHSSMIFGRAAMTHSRRAALACAALSALSACVYNPSPTPTKLTAAAAAIANSHVIVEPSDATKSPVVLEQRGADLLIYSMEPGLKLMSELGEASVTLGAENWIVTFDPTADDAVMLATIYKPAVALPSPPQRKVKATASSASSYDPVKWSPGSASDGTVVVDLGGRAVQLVLSAL
jgi:hypothetical protein